VRVKKPKVVKENSERWLLTYSDLITLLMIFFIILYSMSTTDAKKFEDLTGALKKAFNNGAYQMVTIGGSPGSPGAKPGTMPSEKQMADQLRSQLAKLLKMVGLPQNVVTIGMSQEGIVISISGNLLFYPGNVGLKPDSSVLLGRIAQALHSMPNQVRVEGNTDNQAQPGMSNWTLSSLRAVSIVEFLQGNGVVSTRLQAEGLGQYKPVASNALPEGRAKNRHADIVVLYPST
jgi:chemotaxis protein MotB